MVLKKKVLFLWYVVIDEKVLLFLFGIFFDIEEKVSEYDLFLMYRCIVS